jgi:hypothetical protein
MASFVEKHALGRCGEGLWFWVFALLRNQIQIDSPNPLTRRLDHSDPKKTRNKIMKTQVLLFSLVLAVHSNVPLFAAEASPKTAKEWQEEFTNLVNKSKAKDPSLENLSKLKVVEIFSTLSCHLKERSAALSFKNYSLTEAASAKQRANEKTNEARSCRDGAQETVRYFYKGALLELAKKPDAQKKLKEYVAVWLSLIDRIPRSTTEPRLLEAQQGKEKNTIDQKRTELDVELL